MTIGAMVLDVIFIILGLFFIINPSVGVTSALVLFGVVLIISGLYSIVKYIINGKAIFKFELIYGILSLIIGLLAVFNTSAFANFITTFVGVWLLFSSVFKLVLAAELRRINVDSWTFDLGISALTILLALLLIINPFYGYIVLTTYAAIVVIMYAGFDLVEQLYIRKRANKIIKFLSK